MTPITFNYRTLRPAPDDGLTIPKPPSFARVVDRGHPLAERGVDTPHTSVHDITTRTKRP